MIIEAQQLTVSAATNAGFITIDDVSGVYVGVKLNLSETGQDSLACEIIELNRSTKVLRLRLDTPLGAIPDLSAYSSGVVNVPQQLWADQSGPTEGNGEFEGDVTIDGDLTVYGLDFLPAYATSALPAASASNEGSIVYNTTDNEPQFSDGSVWAAMGGGGVTTMGAIGAVPNANGASISGTTLTLQPADATYGGVLTAGTQSVAGAKTFTSSLGVTGSVTASVSLKVSTNSMTWAAAAPVAGTWVQGDIVWNTGVIAGGNGGGGCTVAGTPGTWKEIAPVSL
jgi:hypothetical protein